MTQQALSFEQVLKLISAVGPEVTVLVEGENGIGKTALFHALTKMEPYASQYNHVDPIDCTQLSDGSVWMPDIDREKGVSRELPNERFGVHRTNQKGVNGARPSFVFLDEIMKAPQFIKNVLAPVIYERRVGNYHMPEGSVVFGATNLSVEGLGDSLQPHLRNRLMVVRMRKPTAEEWVNNYAVKAELAPEVIAFVHTYPQVMDSFLDYEPGGKHSGKDVAKDNPYIFNPRVMQQGYASPRSLTAASKVIKKLDMMDADTLTAALAGVIGEPTAKEMSAYVRFGQEIPAFELVVKGPKKTAIPKNVTAQIVQVFQFITRVDNRDQAAAVTEYVTRMKAEMVTLFCNSVANSTRVVQFATAPGFGKLMADHKIYYSTK